MLHGSVEPTPKPPPFEIGGGFMSDDAVWIKRFWFNVPLPQWGWLLPVAPTTTVAGLIAQGWVHVRLTHHPPVL